VSRRLLPVAAGALLALLAIGALQVLRPSDPPSRAEAAEQLASELRCPDCQGVSVADSHTSAAVAIRARIVELLEAGATPDEVRAHFVDRYGPWILLAPADPLAWLAPALVVLVAALAATLWIWARRRPTTSQDTAVALTNRERERVRAELEELDA